MKNNNKNTKKSIISFKLFCFIVAVLFIYFFFVMRTVYSQKLAIEKDIADMQIKIHDANQERIDLKKQYSIVKNFMDTMEENGNDPIKAFGVLKNGSEYTETDRLIEKTAREKLGFVKANEIIFIDKNK